MNYLATRKGKERKFLGPRISFCGGTYIFRLLRAFDFQIGYFDCHYSCLFAINVHLGLSSTRCTLSSFSFESLYTIMGAVGPLQVPFELSCQFIPRLQYIRCTEEALDKLSPSARYWFLPANFFRNLSHVVQWGSTHFQGRIEWPASKVNMRVRSH